MTKAMKRYLIPILVILLALGLSGCWATGTTTPVPIKTDVPTISQDEVCALVYSYLEARASSVSSIYIRQPLLTSIGIARPYFTATYQGNGKWQVSALGYGLKDKDWVFNYGGLWNFYEASKTIEPANDQATALLSYIQLWTIPQATTQQEPSSQPSAPSQAQPSTAPQAQPSAPSQSIQRQSYLQLAETYQGQAKSDLDTANSWLTSANSMSLLSKACTQESQRDLYMSFYQSDMENYGRYMGNYNNDLQMANEYLLDAQREP